MNRKTLLALAAVAATSATFAAVTSVNTLCRIALELKSKEAVIALPLVDVGDSGSTKIDVTKFVLTDNLVVGTTLQYKSGENWVGWQLTQDGNNKVWTAANVENSAALTKDLERGGAVLLTRPDDGDDATSRTVYLYGQVSEKAVTKEPATGYNLYGNTGTTAMTDVSAIGITPANGDQVIVPTTWTTRSGAVVQIFDYYTYTKTGDSAGSWDKELSIPVGAGFWYKR